MSRRSAGCTLILSQPSYDSILGNRRGVSRPPLDLDGLTSRNGTLRTIAAVHNQANQALPASATLNIERRNGTSPVPEKSIDCRALAYVLLRIFGPPRLANNAGLRDP